MFSADLILFSAIFAEKLREIGHSPAFFVIFRMLNGFGTQSRQSFRA
jgi:hypothetical protein